MALKMDGAGQNGLEEDKITWYSNVQRSRPQSRCGLEEDKIAGYSNIEVFLCFGVEEDKLHGTQTRPVSSSARSGAWKKMKLHGTQTQKGLV